MLKASRQIFPGVIRLIYEDTIGNRNSPRHLAKARVPSSRTPCKLHLAPNRAHCRIEANVNRPRSDFPSADPPARTRAGKRSCGNIQNEILILLEVESRSFQTICPFPRRVLPFASGSRASARRLLPRIEARSNLCSSSPFFFFPPFFQLPIAPGGPAIEPKDREKNSAITSLTDRFALLFLLRYFSPFPTKTYARLESRISRLHPPDVASLAAVRIVRTTVHPTDSRYRWQSHQERCSRRRGAPCAENAVCVRPSSDRGVYRGTVSKTLDGNRRETRTERNRRVRGEIIVSFPDRSDRPPPVYGRTAHFTR